MSRAINKILKPIKRRVVYELARGYRRTLDKLGNVCFIGITGSCGKTTTTELIAAILATQGQTIKCSHTNTDKAIAKTILAVSTKHRFCVNEVAAGVPGLMAKSVKLLRPHIGVVTNIGRDHYTLYRTLEATALDKAKLVEALPSEGTAVLNADDALVFKMRNRTKAKTITYGFSAEATVRGENVSSIWPERMSLDVCFAEKHAHVQTKLLGEHWAHAVLAAIATGIAAGVTVEQAIKAIEDCEPMPYRMCPHQTAKGVTLISDNWKGVMWTVPSSLDFMRKAKAQRKIAIIGSISDTPKSFFDRYKRIIQQSSGIVDKTIFVGEHALTALRAKKNPQDDSVMAFETLYKLDCFLNDYLRPGDLVLLKGVDEIDHLQRIVFSQTGQIKQGNICWRTDCRKTRFCDDCRHLLVPSGVEGNNQTI
jgi:UDP-N-acetylmuramoyl-tripeptide--D-alanyl-D-alanine ligase